MGRPTGRCGLRVHAVSRGRRIDSVRALPVCGREHRGCGFLVHGMGHHPVQLEAAYSPATLHSLTRPGWLDTSELRVGLGCMRLPTDQVALETIAAAADAGVTVFDTARAYEGNERLLAD